LNLSSAPKIEIDPRSAADVARQLQQLLAVYAPDWHDVDPVTGAPGGVSAALIGVSARFAEVLIQRLNQVPQKNFLAFLDLLGAALLPPQPARVPVTFLLAQGSLADAVVPAGTQVAAPPAPGDKDPVIYETENELVATAATLVSAIVRDPDDDTYADYSKAIIATGSSGTPVFHGNQPIAHVLYLGQSHVLDSPAITSLSLIVDLQSGAGDDLALEWGIWDGIAWRKITPSTDGTQNLRQSGTIVFGTVPAAQPTAVEGIEWIRCRLLTPITRAELAHSGMARAAHLPAIRSVGLRVHLHNADALLIDEAYSTAVGLIDVSKDFYPFGEKPKFNDTLWLALEEAFSNAGAAVKLTVFVTSPPTSQSSTPLPAGPSEDLRLRWEVWTGRWITLGTSSRNGPVDPKTPGFTDTTNAFSQDGQVAFTLPAGVASYSVNGKESFWIRVRIVAGNYGVEGHFDVVTGAVAYVYRPPTFRPPSIRSLTVAYDLDRPSPQAAPILPDAILAENDAVFADFTASSPQPFTPFQPSPDLRPTLYLGFILPRGRTVFPNTTITMFLRGAELQYGERTIPLTPDVSRAAADDGQNASHKFVVTNPGPNPITYSVKVLGNRWSAVTTLFDSGGTQVASSPTHIPVPPRDWVEYDVLVTVPAGTPFGASDGGLLRLVSPDQVLYTSEFITFAHEEEVETDQLQLTWEYWNGGAWTTLVVRDDTANLTTTGTIEFLAPPDIAAHREFGTKAWWLRVRWDAGEYDTDPRINQIFLNTTMAAQTVTIRAEVLGSSDGSANQHFTPTRAPVLAGQSLQVREPEIPFGDELKTIRADEGADAVMVIPDSTGKSLEIWVRWHEVPDFYASDARSRHYVLDHITGTITFGDGQSGMIPPVGLANIRLELYKSGGGVRGNRSAGSIVQLKTTVPYIDKVANYVDAGGGADPESMDALVARAPREIRHRGRAVTKEDYEDLVRVASTDVARVLCVPNRDLVAVHLALAGAHARGSHHSHFDRMPPLLGHVSLMVVPNSADPKPHPGVELIRRVETFISTCCPVTATVHVVGPLYLRVDVQVEIGLVSLEGARTVPVKVQDALAAFLHPLTGGFAGQGWEFGREPHRWDIYRVIEQIPEVDHIRALTIASSEELPGSRETGRFLVYSGIHSIKLVFEP
jgi:hypothetical protein